MDESSQAIGQSTTATRQTARRLVRAFLPHFHIALALLLTTSVYTACMTARVAMILPALRIFKVVQVTEDDQGKKETKVETPFLEKIDFSEALAAWDRWQTDLENRLVEIVDKVPGIDVDSMEVKTRAQLGTIAALILFFLILTAASAVTNFGKQYLSSLLVVRALVSLRVKLLSNLLNQELAFYNEQKRGELVTRMSSDVQAATACMRLMTKELLEAPLMVLMPVIVLIWVQWWFGLILLAYLFTIAKSLRKQTKKVHKRAHKRQKTVSRVHEAMLQMFSGIRVVKAFGLEDQKIAEYSYRNEDFARQSMATAITKALTRVRMELFVNGAIVVVLIVGLFLIGGDTTVDPASIGFLLGALIHIYKPMKTATRSVTEFLDHLAGSQRVFEYMDLEPELKDKRGAIEATDIVGTVRFEDVSFSYDGNGRVLDHINLEVPAGEVVALVGPSGAGKSTLVNMVPRFHDPGEGAITVDGTDIREFQRESLLRSIAIVTQDPFLFHASIRENIAYGKTNATHDEIVSAARAANIDDFIQTLPMGYDTVVGEGGGKLSGGQKQRLTIARAIVRDARILILDEATSNLDTESEKAVQAALEHLMEGRTTLVIAHRLSTVQHADKICVLQDGRICEMGSHDQLMASDSLYRRLYQLQFAPRASE
ncbi:MAG: ABC transporter ATP-binding protein [Planctomycetota bacterium]|jgi:subfamily B ATP-binding cassette protein MsbA